ncbi:MAG: FtsK/SpoIIIE domain-containing protein [Pseudoclavibacter sp.]|nr:FtsK/SpoIIIE domain-containing protein [Pseudoclavibacter sp.]
MNAVPSGPRVRTPVELEPEPIRIPVREDAGEAPQLSLLMVLAPVAAALALFLLTGSTATIAFAAFGPVLGIAGFAEQRRRRRRRLRRIEERYRRELHAARTAIEGQLAAAMERAWAAEPHPLALMDRTPPAWALDAGGARPQGPPSLRIGVTDLPSGLRVETVGEADAQAQELLRRARRLAGAPLAIEAEGIRLCCRGDAGGVLRALLVQAVRRCEAAPVVRIESGPDALRLRAQLDPLVEAGLVLPEGSRAAEPGRLEIRVSDAGSAAESAVAGRDHLLLQGGDGSWSCRAPGSPAVAFLPDTVGEERFALWAERLAARMPGPSSSEAGGEEPEPEGLPERLAFAELPPCEQTGAGLPAVLGMAAHGPLCIDLVRDGPHAVVGGTTGSGKSELLISWLLALAAREDAHRLQLLCIDFKGGATFDALRPLPQLAGIVTDLDGGESIRVVASLRAELRRRERLLRQAGARDVAAADGIVPRLVVVVDEFQALLQEHPETHDAFTDLAARGRSLGVHLVLCAQRPTGAIRDALLANCAIRVSLRVTDPADSRALLGDAAAASLPAQPRGRAVVRVDGRCERLQIARSTPADVERVAALHPLDPADRPSAPWQPPLPADLPLAELQRLARQAGTSALAVPFALGDDPASQCRPIVALGERCGPLLVLGSGGSGKTTALETIALAAEAAGEPVLRIPSPEAPEPLEDAWDAVAAWSRRAPAGVVCLDDVDLLVARLGEEHGRLWVERVADLARSAGAHRLVLAAQRLTGPCASLASLARRTLRLPFASRNDYVLSGGEGTDHLVDAPPGRGRCDRLLVQIARAEAPRRGPERFWGPTRLPGTAKGAAPVRLAVASARPVERAAGLRAAGWRILPVPAPGQPPQAEPAEPDRAGRGAVFLGGFEAWQQSFGALRALSGTMPVVVDGASAGELRQLLPGGQTPPFIADPTATAVLRTPDGTMRRLRWPRDGEPCWPAAGH